MCLVGLDDRTFVVEEHTNSGSPRTDVTLTIGLNDGRRVAFHAFVAFAGPSSVASDSEVVAMVPAPDIVSEAPCDQGVISGRTAGDIDGMWSGKRAVYDLQNDSGYTEPHQMICSSQHCNIQTQVFIDLGFSDFDALGVWRAHLTGASATAVMSPDGQAMAMWICAEGASSQGALPLGSECQLYGFNRLTPG